MPPAFDVLLSGSRGLLIIWERRAHMTSVGGEKNGHQRKREGPKMELKKQEVTRRGNAAARRAAQGHKRSPHHANLKVERDEEAKERSSSEPAWADLWFLFTWMVPPGNACVCQSSAGAVISPTIWAKGGGGWQLGGGRVAHKVPVNTPQHCSSTGGPPDHICSATLSVT